MPRRKSIKIERDAPNAHGEFESDQFHHGIEVDVLVMLTGGCLECRREYRPGKPVRDHQSRRQRDAAHAAVRNIVLEAGTYQVAARNRFDRQRLELLYDHGSTGQLGALAGIADDVLDAPIREVICGDIAGAIEPERGDARQHLTLERNWIRQHYVERREPVRCHDQEMLRVDVIDVAHLALVDALQAADVRFKQRW